LMEKYLNGEVPSEDELKQAARKGVIGMKITPPRLVVQEQGVQPMLDAVVDYLPSPLDLPPVDGMDMHDSSKAMTREAKYDAPFSAIAFKIMTDPYVGQLTFFSVYSGTLNTGDFVFNPIKE